MYQKTNEKHGAGDFQRDVIENVSRCACGNAYVGRRDNLSQDVQRMK